MKKIALLIIVVFLLAACTSTEAIEPEDRTNATMTQEEAYETAINSICVKEGNVINEAYYNDFTRTWWFETDIAKEGCNPECMVNEESQTAEINWMCTGLKSE